MKNEYDYLNDVNMDFSIYEEENISEEEVVNMKNEVINSKKKRPMRYVAIACAAVVAVTCTAFAGQGIIRVLSTGHNEFYQVDANAPQELPKALKGKVFDKEGKALNAVTKEDLESIYDRQGNKISNEKLMEMFDEALKEEGVTTFKDDADYNPEDYQISYSSIEEAQQKSDFDIKVPEYIPEGYSFLRVYQFKDNEGKASGLYANIEYTNEKGDKIAVDERLLNEETAFSSGGDSEIEAVKINGRDAVITGGSSIDWETEDSVAVGIRSKGKLSKEEIIKMAESVK